MTHRALRLARRADRGPVRRFTAAWLKDKREDGLEAIQFIIIGSTVTAGLAGVWGLTKDGQKRDSTRITSCLQVSDELLGVQSGSNVANRC